MSLIRTPPMVGRTSDAVRTPKLHKGSAIAGAIRTRSPETFSRPTHQFVYLGNHQPNQPLVWPDTGRFAPMTADECNDRATNCATNAALARNEVVALDFLRMAAQWRAMATQRIF